MGFLLFFFPKFAFQRAVKRHLPDSADELWRSTLAWQSKLAPSRPRHSTSVNLVIRHMEWGCALYRALQEQGMGRSEAGLEVESIISDIYQPVPATMSRLSRLRSPDHETRVRWLLLRVVTRRVFSAPFIHRYHNPETGVAYDVTRCPLADYFDQQDVPELTPHAACNMDYRLAEELGANLIRTQTIAEGAEYCDFRWEVPVSISA